jgi:hypothetical protein
MVLLTIVIVRPLYRKLTITRPETVGPFYCQLPLPLQVLEKVIYDVRPSYAF